MKRITTLLLVASVACSMSAGCKDPPGAVDAGVAEVPVPGGDGDIVGSGESISATIGSDGGTLSLGGSTIDIPAGALSEMTTITVTETTTPTPPGYRAFSPLFRFEPEGLVFAAPVTVRLPSSASSADAPLATLFWSRAEDEGGGWQRIGGIPSGGVVTGSVEHFSFGFLADGVDYTETPDRSCVQTRVLDWRPLRSSGSGLGLFFTMDDCWGRPITDLTNDELVVFEDGVALSSEASAQLYEQRGLHVFVTLAIDVSSSTQPILPEVVSAARRFVETLNDPARGLRDRVQVSILAFAGNDVGPNDPNDWEAQPKTDLWQRHTLDLDLVLTRLDDLAAHIPSDPSSTNLHGALVYSLERNTAAQQAFRERNRGGAFSAGYVVLFTDGADTAGRVDFQTARAELEASLDDVVAVGLHGDDYDPTALRALVGEAQVIDSEDEVVLDRDFGYLAARIAGQVRRSYLLGYCSPKRSGNHTVHVGVEGAETRVSGIVPDFFAGNFTGGCTVEMFDPAVVCAEAECGGFGCGACDDRVASCDNDDSDGPSPTGTGECVDFCAQQSQTCGGNVMTNPLGYQQTCNDNPGLTLCTDNGDSPDGGYDVCANLTADESNCGTCGETCALGGTCVDGACTCPTGHTVCSEQCTDLESDVNHCGTCGNVCNLLCEVGECVEVASIAAGAGRHTCAVLTDGSGRCWGDGSDGKLGNGSNADVSTPVVVSGLSQALAVSAGALHTCAVRGGGDIVCWGKSFYLGNGSNSSALAPVSGLSDAIAVAAGWAHSCAVRETGEVVCWGSGTEGQLGSSISFASTPIVVAELADAVAVTVGRMHTCALRAGGEVVCWGKSLYLGNDSNSSAPAPVSGLSDAIAVAAGEYHSCAVRVTGEVVCWGSGGFGQLGNGSTDFASTPVSVANLVDAIDVDAGTNHTCAIRETGEIVCWGRNVHGELGDSSTTSAYTPVAVSGFSNAVTVAAGGGHTCAILAAGTASCWGYGALGQLGNGTLSNRLTPTAVQW